MDSTFHKLRARWSSGFSLPSHSVVFLFVHFALCLACPAQTLTLFTNAQVRSEGLFLADIISASTGGEGTSISLPYLRLCDSPAFGQAISLTQKQISDLLKTNAPEFAAANWRGAERIRITRRARPLAEAELLEQLTALLQRESVRDKGDLELRPIRPWSAVTIPDEPYTLKVVELPSLGVTPNFILRFELATPREKFGPWQVPLTAKVWREIWIARSALKRDEVLADADVTRERRDLLTLREAPFSIAEPDSRFEIAEQVPAGSPIYGRSVRLRPVVRRGQVVDAQLQDGVMSISVKVEVLENGAPGQLVRVRNPQSRREFKGKVQNEQTILVSL